MRETVQGVDMESGCSVGGGQRASTKTFVRPEKWAELWIWAGGALRTALRWDCAS